MEGAPPPTRPRLGHNSRRHAYPVMALAHMGKQQASIASATTRRAHTRTQTHTRAHLQVQTLANKGQANRATAALQTTSADAHTQMARHAPVQQEQMQ
eukprot:1605452-Alexandrium_andersonii.AAC.1